MKSVLRNPPFFFFHQRVVFQDSMDLKWDLFYIDDEAIPVLKWKTKNTTVRTVPKSNQKIVFTQKKEKRGVL